MMNHRALVRAHTHWRPRRAAPATSVGTAPMREPRRRRAVWLAAFAALLAGLAVALVLRHADGRAAVALPATPRAWLEAFSADVATGSGEVCSRLLSPTFTSELEQRGPQVLRQLLRERAGPVGAHPADPCRAAPPRRSRSATGRAAAIRPSCSITRPRAGRPSRSCPVGPCLPPEAYPTPRLPTRPPRAAGRRRARASYQLSIGLRMRANVSEGQSSL